LELKKLAAVAAFGIFAAVVGKDFINEQISKKQAQTQQLNVPGPERILTKGGPVELPVAGAGPLEQNPVMGIAGGEGLTGITVTTIPVKPMISGATVGTTPEGKSAQVVASTTTVTVSGTNLPQEQTLQAAAQLTGQSVISSTSVQALTGTSSVPSSISVPFSDPLFPILNSRFVEKTTNTSQQGGIIGYEANGNPIIGYAPVTALGQYQEVNGAWYGIQVIHFGQIIVFTPMPIVDVVAKTVTYPPPLPNQSNA